MRATTPHPGWDTDRVQEGPGDEVQADLHRRRASYLYGLIVSGAVLAATPPTDRLELVALTLLGTLVVYWAAETYVHWMTARAVLHRDLTGPERRGLVLDGWPLVAACAVPVAVLVVEELLRIDGPRAVEVALLVNAGLLVVVGHSMGRDSGLTGWRLAGSSVLAGVLGLAVVGLKTLLH